MNWRHILLILLMGIGTQRFVCVCVCVCVCFLFVRSVPQLYIKVQLWPKYMGYKSVMLLRTSLGTLWDLGGNLLGFRWESSVNTLGTTTTKKNLSPRQNPKGKKIGPSCMHVEPSHYWPHENYGLKS